MAAKDVVLPFALYLWLESIILTVIAISCLWIAKQLLVVHVFGLQPLNSLDEFFLLDSKNNRANIVTVLKFAKLKDPVEFLNFVKTHAMKAHPKCQSVLVKYLDEYFFKRVTDSSTLQKLASQAFTLDPAIKGDKALLALIGKEQAIRDNLNAFQYKFIVAPNFSDTESAMIFKSHHCFGDGVATLVLTSALTKSYSPDQFSRLAPRGQSAISFLFGLLTLPFAVLETFRLTFSYPYKPNNVYDRYSRRLTGVKQAAFSRPLCTTEHSEKARKAGMSINDVILASANVALAQFIGAKDCQVYLPFTLRDFPASLAELKVDNNFAAMPVVLQFPEPAQNGIDLAYLSQVFPQVLKQMKSEVRSTRTRNLAFGWYIMMNYFMGFLRVPMIFKPSTVATAPTTVLSSVPGKKTPYVFDFDNGVVVKELVYFISGTGRCACGISLITHGSKVQLGICCDSSYFLQPNDYEEFVKTFEQVFEICVKVL